MQKAESDKNDDDNDNGDANNDNAHVTKMMMIMMTTTMEIKIMITPRSVGICLLELAEGHPPLSHLHPMRALMQVGLKN